MFYLLYMVSHNVIHMLSVHMLLLIQWDVFFELIQMVVFFEVGSLASLVVGTCWNYSFHMFSYVFMVSLIHSFIYTAAVKFFGCKRLLRRFNHPTCHACHHSGRILVSPCRGSGFPLLFKTQTYYQWGNMTSIDMKAIQSHPKHSRTMRWVGLCAWMDTTRLGLVGGFKDESYDCPETEKGMENHPNWLLYFAEGLVETTNQWWVFVRFL